ncbi:MAG: CpaD family pilus assembly lipoprotein [Alphaproteobacteria bacterium]|nr:CpaD family pilus assembly lipoprotein [Alphaproteobacteria bacterium]
MKTTLIRGRQSLRTYACRLGGLALAAVALAACAPGSKSMDPTAGWLEAGSPKELEVDRAQYRHTVYFPTDRDDINGGEQDRLIAFLQAVQPKDSDNIRVEGHADARATDLYNLDLAARRMETVKGFLSENGIRRLDMHASAFGERAPAVAGAGETAWRQNRRVEIVLERYLVTPPACPDWSRRSGIDYANKPHTNFGCATATNLGLMIADPRDLVRGRDLGPADGIHQADGIIRYRKGEQPELQEERVN